MKRQAKIELKVSMNGWLLLTAIAFFSVAAAALAGEVFLTVVLLAVTGVFLLLGAAQAIRHKE
jgi:hypothetical protein